MRLRPFAFLLVLAACGGGGGGPAPTPEYDESFSFALVRADQPTVRDVTVANPIDAEATIELVEAPGGGFSIPDLFFPAVVGVGGDLVVPVTFTPGAEPAAEGVLVVRATGPDGKAIVRVTLSATLETPTVALVSGDLAFGDVLVGESAQRTVQVRNTSVVTPVQVAPATVLPAGFAFPGSSFPLGPGETASLVMTYAPTGLANHDLTYTIAHNASSALLSFRVTAMTTTWVPLIETDFGSVAVVNGETEWLEVEVPPHAVSLQLEALGTDVVIGLLGFEGPGGFVYENAEATGDYLWFTGVEGVFTAMLPSSDRPELRLVDGGGTYRFRFFLIEGSATSLDVRAIVRNEPQAVVPAGVLDLNVFLADGLGIAVGDAPTHVRIQGMLDEADRILGQQNLSLGQVDYYAITDSSFDTMATDAEFADLLETSSAANATRLNVFLVLGTPGGSVGVTSRIFGPTRNGTRASGLAVDFDYGSVTQSGYVLAHETCHYLGLTHTTEQSGTFDVIDDTLECPATGTGNGCDTEGDDNLMHWRVLSADPLLTDGQGGVILVHPLIVPASSSPALAQRAGASPLLIGALPDGWCGTPGCCGTPK